MIIQKRQTVHLIANLAKYIDGLDEQNELNIHVRENMAVSLAAFFESAVTKFIAGQREHGGDLTKRNLDEEVRKEHVDMFWYSYAKDWPQVV